MGEKKRISARVKRETADVEKAVAEIAAGYAAGIMTIIPQVAEDEEEADLKGLDFSRRRQLAILAAAIATGEFIMTFQIADDPEAKEAREEFNRMMDAAWKAVQERHAENQKTRDEAAASPT